MSRRRRVAFRLIGGGAGASLAGHLFDTLEEAERWLGQPYVARSYGLDEVSLSPNYCHRCRRPVPVVIRRVHDVGAFAKMAT